ncbi:MAG: oligo-1 6-glucosidase [Erysipelotrichaceae bacterium]|nr:MAG: oligo-1 [Erysipelotrichaceae bacterium]TXT18818.1 MAG: oligo-1 6-glucosidase [Erysipelotrichaceae bacterium]
MNWWQESVVYQIYPRSFKDSNQDGIGDLQGIISKLDYLSYLGIDVIWLCPVYESPNEDNGYDISDYFSIMRDFGSMSDMEELIQKSKKHGISIVMDIVANHTSSEHRWFKEAQKSVDNPYRQYYVFKPNTGKIPSDLKSIFLGSAWSLDEQTNSYYLHLFAKSQPDLNWHYKPVRDELYQMINWWLDKGIQGFRFDVIDLVAKDLDQNKISDGPKLHDYIQELNLNCFKKHSILTVGETWGATTEKAKRYSNLDGSEFSMIFNFSHILLDQEPGKEKWDTVELDLVKLKKVFNDQQVDLYQKGWNSLFWNNHDLPRIVSRWGNDQEYREQSAKMLGTLLHFMQGTPYIYQGEELGMTNVKFESFSDYRDIETQNMIRDRRKKGLTDDQIMASIQKIGRDNARTPFPWNKSDFGGFSEVQPWINMNPNYSLINAQEQLGRVDSVLEYYRKLIWFRRVSNLKDIIRDGQFELMYSDHKDLFAYKRILGSMELKVYCNFHSHSIHLNEDVQTMKLILSNYDEIDSNHGLNLRPYEAIVLEGKGNDL